jgi:PAS domain S-box-containing protein
MGGGSDILVAGGMMGELIRKHDWGSTTLGRPETWPQTLRTALNIMICSGHAMCIIWGPERTILYNDAYAPILGGRHPAALGRSTEEVWPELWDDIKPLIDRTFAGEACVFRDQPLTMTRNGFAEETWWDFAYSPIHDARGSVAGLLNVTSDSTARVIALREREVALNELTASEAFVRSILASSTDCIKVIDLDGRLTFMSEGGQKIMEVSDFNAIEGCPWPGFWEGAGKLEAIAAIEHARRGETRSFVGQASTMGGTHKWWHVAVSPVLDSSGRPDRILSVSRDISALRASEEERDRFVRLAENSTDFIGMAWTDGTLFYLNNAARHMVGVEGADVTTLTIADFFAPDEAAKVANEVLPAVTRDGHWSGEVAFRHFGTGEAIPALYSVFSITDASGAVIGYGTVTRDFRDRKRAENELALMNGELAHRLKNVLAIVQSVCSQTLRTALDTETANRDLTARLAALGAATDVLTSRSWRSANLQELVERTLAPHAAIGERILINGPQVMLKAEVSVALVLALHELATNAAKYGALSNDSGFVSLTWAVKGVGEDAAFSIRWEEQGGPEVLPPTRTGFGTRLIERSLRAYFRGQVATVYRPEGLLFQLNTRLADAAAAIRN